jgi:L-galactose dehydrogenase
MEYRLLGRTALEVSALGLGASSLGGVFRDVQDSEAIDSVRTALDLGINFIDVSPFYGLTRAETVLGKALKGIARDKYVLATKVGRYGPEMKDFDFSPRRVTASVEESLARLGLEHVDLIQAHDIEFGDLDEISNQTIPALRKLQQQGRVRFVGVTGLPLAALRRIVRSSPVDTVLSYCHYELNDTALTGLISTLKQRGIGIISASPLGMGLLTHRGTPSWHPAPACVKQACAKAAAYCQARGDSIERLAIQFALANPDIATTLVGSANPKNMRKNIEWASQPMDRALLAEVRQILERVIDVTWPSGRPENNS